MSCSSCQGTCENAVYVWFSGSPLQQAVETGTLHGTLQAVRGQRRLEAQFQMITILYQSMKSIEAQKFESVTDVSGLSSKGGESYTRMAVDYAPE